MCIQQCLYSSQKTTLFCYFFTKLHYTPKAISSFMNKFLLFACLLFALSTTAQTGKIKIKKKKETKREQRRAAALNSMMSIDAYYGTIVYKDDFYKQLNTGKSFGLNTPPTFVGIGMSGFNYLIGPTYFVYQLDAQKYLPQQIIINDSTKSVFSGASFGIGIGKCLSSPKGNLSITYYLGFNSGRCTLTNSENISAQKQFFCPKVSLQPKLMIRRLAVSMVIAAQGDITSAKWLPKYSGGRNEVPINGFYQTGFIGMLSLGYRI